MLLILVVAGAVVGMYAIAANVSMNAPVDGYGTITPESDNLTRSNVSAVAQVVPTTAVFLALIVAAIVLAVVVIYMASALSGIKGNNRSRYR